MKTLALLGGMTYEATSLYYSTINSHIRTRLGGRYSAKLLMESYNFHRVLALMNAGKWSEIADIFCTSAVHLKSAGADALVIRANYPHMVAHEVEFRSGLRLLHIADFTGEAIVAAGQSKVGLLGTKAVMEESYIKGKLEDGFGVRVLVPDDPAVRQEINNELMNTLVKGVVTTQVKALLLSAAEDLIEKGAEGLILGSTDLGFAIREGDLNVPLFDTNKLHAVGVAEWVLEDEDYREAGVKKP